MYLRVPSFAWFWLLLFCLLGKKVMAARDFINGLRGKWTMRWTVPPLPSQIWPRSVKFPVKYDRSSSRSKHIALCHCRFLSHNKQDHIRTTFLFMSFRVRSIDTLFDSLQHFRILIFPSSLQTIPQSTTTSIKINLWFTKWMIISISFFSFCIFFLSLLPYFYSFPLTHIISSMVSYFYTNKQYATICKYAFDWAIASHPSQSINPSNQFLKKKSVYHTSILMH